MNGSGASFRSAICAASTPPTARPKRWSPISCGTRRACPPVVEPTFEPPRRGCARTLGDGGDSAAAVAATALAVTFEAWRSLAGQGLDDATIADLMTRFIAAAGNVRGTAARTARGRRDGETGRADAASRAKPSGAITASASDASGTSAPVGPADGERVGPERVGPDRHRPRSRRPRASAPSSPTAAAAPAAEPERRAPRQKARARAARRQRAIARARPAAPDDPPAAPG